MQKLLPIFVALLAGCSAPHTDVTYTPDGLVLRTTKDTDTTFRGLDVTARDGTHIHIDEAHVVGSASTVVAANVELEKARAAQMQSITELGKAALEHIPKIP